jgi:hypothetical protein
MIPLGLSSAFYQRGEQTLRKIERTELPRQISISRNADGVDGYLKSHLDHSQDLNGVEPPDPPQASGKVLEL